MKKIRYILILVIGSVLFWVGTSLLVTQLRPPPSNWPAVIPEIEGRGSTNLTTSAFNITGEKWKVAWHAPFRELYNTSGIQLFVEVYNASTNEKLQEFAFSGNFTKSYGSKELNTTGSFYMKIQVYGNATWQVRVREYKPPPGFPAWIAWIAAIGVASLVAFFGYKKLRHK